MLDQDQLLDNTDLVLVLGPMLIFALVYESGINLVLGFGIRQESHLVLLPQVPHHAGISITRLLALHQVISDWYVLQENQYSYQQCCIPRL